ncbi:MAG: hypothetical protein ACR2LR_17005 [Hassallia sp.]
MPELLWIWNSEGLGILPLLKFFTPPATQVPTFTRHFWVGRVPQQPFFDTVMLC